MLKDLRQHLAGAGHPRGRDLFFEDFAHAAFIGRIGMRVDEAHRDGLDAFAAQDASHPSGVFLIKACQYLASVVHALGDLDAVAAADVRRSHVLVGVPQVFLRTPADLDDVSEAAARYHRGTRETTGDQRIGRDRGAVREQSDVVKIDTRFLHTLQDRIDRVCAGREFFDPHFSRSIVKDADIGERASHVHGYPDAARAHFFASWRLRKLDPTPRLKIEIGSCIKMPI